MLAAAAKLALHTVRTLPSHSASHLLPQFRPNPLNFKALKYSPLSLSTVSNFVRSLSTALPLLMEDLSMNPLSPSEADTHVAHLANLTPPTHVPIHDHAPYPEMILGAISALKERDGSSKRAIFKNIEKGCLNLPPAHSTLLTHHLKLLKNNGQLIMVKHSYKLPESTATLNTNEAHTDAPAASIGPPRPKVDATAASLSNPKNANKPGSKRGRGRPPKPDVTVVIQPSGEDGSDAMLSSLGPVQKRRSGRPPKAGTSTATAAPSGNVGRARSRLKKGILAKQRGRPPKKAQHVPFAGDGGLVLGVPKPKKPRKLTGKPLGRPKKNASKATVDSTDSQYVVAYQVLKTKYEQIHLKVQQAVSLIKPHLNSQTPDSVVRALEEMEELARADESAPMNG